MRYQLSRQRLTLFSLLMLFAVFFAACATPAAPAASPASEGESAATSGPSTVRIGWKGSPDSLNPGVAVLIESYTLFFLVYDSLMIYNLDGTFSPGLAESWTTSADGLVWTFKMRSDAKWSDGKPVTAKDVEYSVKRAIKPETASPYAYVLYIIKNAKSINQTVVPTDTYDIDTIGVKAIDDSTVEFTLEAPASYFLSISSMWTLRPVPSWAIEAHGDAWTEPANIVVNGPYKLSEWKAGESL